MEWLNNITQREIMAGKENEPNEKLKNDREKEII